uniref:Protein GrpE n=1 Tax=Mycoplasma mobile (strain ATCC 43663 / 163K / NCTC 11711) TaxID=267748 RepID=GRPE_MYCM1|nr:RecName: Full=Protein GrpE; AltName: Full=HSP-70 cofactor [Mycoplasma mobile 163K]
MIINYKFSDFYFDKKLSGKEVEFSIQIQKREASSDKNLQSKNLIIDAINVQRDFSEKNKSSDNLEILNKQIEDKNDLIINLEKKVFDLTLENKKNIDDFNEKAKSFAKKAQEELDKYKLELKSFLENEFEEKKKFSFQKLFENIINPLNNFRLAIDAGSKQENSSIKSYVQGFEMLLNQTINILESYGLIIIRPEIGDTFNPEVHNAVELREEGTPNRILKINSLGYQFHERVLKPASVIVSK